MQSGLLIFIKDSVVNILFNHGRKNRLMLKELFNHNNYVVEIFLIYVGNYIIIMIYVNC